MGRRDRFCQSKWGGGSTWIAYLLIVLRKSYNFLVNFLTMEPIFGLRKVVMFVRWKYRKIKT